MKVGSFLERRRIAITWILAGAIFLLASPRPWSLVLLFALFVVPLYHTVMRREEAFLEERFGEDFQAYRQAVPLFLPRLTPFLRQGEPFDWGLVRKHRERYVWAGIAGVTLLLAGRYYWL
jgi:hypothetical protein